MGGQRPTAYTGPSLLVQFTQIADRTVLRADTFLAARYAVSERHRIIDDVVAVRINRIRPPSPGINEESNALPPVELNAPEDAAQIGRLVDSFNRLYGSVTVPNVMSCPQSPPAKDTMTFSTAAKAAPQAPWSPSSSPTASARST